MSVGRQTPPPGAIDTLHPRSWNLNKQNQGLIWDQVGWGQAVERRRSSVRNARSGLLHVCSVLRLRVLNRRFRDRLSADLTFLLSAVPGRSKAGDEATSAGRMAFCFGLTLAFAVASARGPSVCPLSGRRRGLGTTASERKKSRVTHPTVHLMTLSRDGRRSRRFKYSWKREEKQRIQQARSHSHPFQKQHPVMISCSRRVRAYREHHSRVRDSPPIVACFLIRNLAIFACKR